MKTVRNIFSLLCAAIVCLTVASEGRAVENTLNPKQQSIIAISSFTANGDLEKLKSALNEGLDAGLTVNEIKEILVQLYAYAGFPRSLNGINTFMAVMDERKAKGFPTRKAVKPAPCPRTGTVTNTALRYGRGSAAGTPSPRPAVTSFSRLLSTPF